MFFNTKYRNVYIIALYYIIDVFYLYILWTVCEKNFESYNEDYNLTKYLA